MPFAHRNLLTAMLVGCVVVVMGTGKTAHASDDNLTIKIALASDMPANVRLDDFFYYFNAGALGSNVTITDIQTGDPVPMKTTHWHGPDAEGLNVNGSFSGAVLLVGYDPTRTGIPPGTNCDGGNPTNAAYRIRYQPVEFTYVGSGSSSADITYIDYYSLPLNIEVIAGSTTLSRNCSSTDLKIRQAIDKIAPASSKVMSSSGNNFVRYCSPNKDSSGYPKFDDYITSINSNGSVVAKLSDMIDVSLLPTTYCMTWGECDGGAPSHNKVWNVNKTASNGDVSFNISDPQGNDHPVFITGSLSDWTSAIYHNARIWSGGQLHVVTEGSCGHTLCTDLLMSLNMGWISSTQAVNSVTQTSYCPFANANDTFVAAFSIDGDGTPFNHLGSDLASGSWKWCSAAYSQVQGQHPYYNVWSDALYKTAGPVGYFFPNDEFWRGRGPSPQFNFTNASSAAMTITVKSFVVGPVTCNGDLDNSLHTDIDDLLLVVEGWGTVHGDITGDGLTNIDDLLVVLKDWGCDHR